MQSVKVSLTTPQFQKSFKHNLGQTPNYVRLVLLCDSADASSGMQPGDELDLSSSTGLATDPDYAPNFGVRANSENIILCSSGFPASECQVAVGTTVEGNNVSAAQFSDFANFSLKAYFGTI